MLRERQSTGIFFMYDLNDFFLFSGLATAEKNKIISTFSQPVFFQKNSIIYDASHFEHALGIMMCGAATSFSGEVLRRSFEEGDCFGAAAVFGADRSYSSSIIAVKDCYIQFIEEGPLRILLMQDARIALNYITFLSEKIRFLNHKIMQFTSKGTAAKLYRYLLEACSEDGAVSVKSMAELARTTGMGRTSLYRALSTLEQNHMIIRKKKGIKVL